MGSIALNLLLDTHVWLWTLLEPNRLRASASELIDAEENRLWLSPISVWETALLHERGRVELDGGPSAWLERALAAIPMSDAPLNRDVALASRRIKLATEDPADRFIAASALVHELTLVTADEELLAGDAYEALPAD